MTSVSVFLFSFMFVFLVLNRDSNPTDANSSNSNGWSVQDSFFSPFSKVLSTNVAYDVTSPDENVGASFFL